MCDCLRVPVSDRARFAMKLLSAQPLFWSSLLVLFWFSQKIESSNQDHCEDILIHGFQRQDASHKNKIIHIGQHNISCFLYPTNILNCSWSLHLLQKDAQLSVYIRICDSNTTVLPQSLISEDSVGSWSMVLHGYNELYVILSFNVSLHNMWTDYSVTYDTDTLEVLLPPSNLSASVKDGNLLVTWVTPTNRRHYYLSCFEYQMDIGNQEKPKHFHHISHFTHQSHTMNADPTYTYRVRIRARIISDCTGSTQWSDWSHVVTVEQSVYKLNTLVIVSISLGIPMILLAVLLLVRHQRVSKVLFPQIPRPPPKYKCFLEKNETCNFLHPAPLAKPEEKITEVEDAEQNPGKTF
ncbi:hypothetical protein PAMA_005396 [Pampus argenteus]